MQDGLLKVLSVIEDAPAAKAGVLANDIITHLDGEATRGMTNSQALEKMRGPVYTAIRLRIAREGHNLPIELTLVRAGVQLAGFDLQVDVKDGRLRIEGRGALPILDFEQGVPIAVVPMSTTSSSWMPASIREWPSWVMVESRRAWCSIPGPGKSRVGGSTDRRRKGDAKVGFGSWLCENVSGGRVDALHWSNASSRCMRSFSES
jgi:hypothetical protein